MELDAIIASITLNPKGIEEIKRAEQALERLNETINKAESGSLEWVDAMKKATLLERTLGRETQIVSGSIEDLEREVSALTSAQRKLDLSTQSGVKNYKALQTQINQTNAKMKMATGVVNGQGNTMMAMAGRLGPMLAVAFSVDRIIEYGKKIFEATAKFEKFEAVLANTLGGKGQAQQALAQIRDFAAKTPFQVDEITDSFIKLANNGFRPTTAELTKLGDLASSRAKSIQQLTDALIDAETFELERLKEFGIVSRQTGDKILFTFKGVTTTVARTSQAVREYILSLGALEGVSGQMAAVNKTLAGQVSNLGDNFDLLLLNLGNSMNTFFNALVSGASDAINFFNSAFKKNAQEISRASLANNTLAKSGQELLNRYKELTKDGLIPTIEQKGEMADITLQLQNMFGSSVVSINQETQAFVVNTEAVEASIRARLLLANTDAQQLVLQAKNAEKQKQLALQRISAIEELATSIQQSFSETGLDASALSDEFKKVEEASKASIDAFAKSGGIMGSPMKIASKELSALTKEQRAAIERFSKLLGSKSQVEKELEEASRAYQEAIDALKNSGFTEQDYENLFSPPKIEEAVKAGAGTIKKATFNVKEAMQAMRLAMMQSKIDLLKNPELKSFMQLGLDEEKAKQEAEQKIADFIEKGIKAGASKAQINEGVALLREKLKLELEKMNKDYEEAVFQNIGQKKQQGIDISIDVELDEEDADKEIDSLQEGIAQKLGGLERDFERRRVKIRLGGLKTGDRKRELEEQIALEQEYLRTRLEQMKVLLGASAEIDAFEAEQLEKIKALQDQLKSTEEQELETRKKVYADFAIAVKNTLNDLLAFQIKQIDQEVDYRKDRIDYLSGIQSASAEAALKEEQDRQAEALKERERFARAQQIIGAIEAGTNIVVGITKVFAESGVASLGTLPAVLGVLTAVLAGAPALIAPLLGFKDGVVGFKGEGTGTSDSNIVRISHGESIITAKGTALAPEALNLINKGKLSDDMLGFPKVELLPFIPLKPESNKGDTRALEERLSENNALMREMLAKLQSPTFVDYRFDEHGFTKRIKKIERRNRGIDNMR